MNPTDPLHALRAAFSTKYEITPVMASGAPRYSPSHQAPAPLGGDDTTEERSDASAQGREQRNGSQRAARWLLHARGCLSCLVAVRHARLGVHAAGVQARPPCGQVCQPHGAEEHRRLAPACHFRSRQHRSAIRCVVVCMCSYCSTSHIPPRVKKESTTPPGTPPPSAHHCLPAPSASTAHAQTSPPTSGRTHGDAATTSSLTKRRYVPDAATQFHDDTTLATTTSNYQSLEPFMLL